MIDLSFTSKQLPLKGSLLISDPFTGDSYFTRSVVLLCDHDETGTFGFVLNNFVQTELKALVPKFPFEGYKLGIGGPVDTDNIFYFHTYGEEIEGATQICENLYFGGDFDQLIKKLTEDNGTNGTARFFLGYAGWAPSQLADEICQNSWIVTNNIDVEEIMQTKDEQLWNKLMKKQGGKFKLMADFPLNPMNN